MKIYVLLLALIFLLSPIGVQIDALAGGKLKKAELSKPYKEGEIIVKFKNGKELKTQALHRQIGAKVVKSIRLKSATLELVKLPLGMSVEEGIRLYMQDSNVEYAEPNYIIRKSITPNDPYFDRQWSLHNIGQMVKGVVGVTDADIDAPEAWDLHTGNGSVVVAVLDTGVDYNHPDLAENIWINQGEIPDNGVDDDSNGYVDDVRGWDFAYNDNNPMDDDVDFHGTHVAGIIGAVGNNSLGVSGVAWRVKIMPLKFLGSDGGGTVADEVEAIRYAIRNGAKVINASYAYPYGCYSTTPSWAERDAIAEANDAGVLFITAAGNYGCDNDRTPFYPAGHRIDNIISVSATNSEDVLASWSNYGLTSVHVSAPGVNIYSTIKSSSIGYGGVQGYDFLSGTSMATPFVSGLTALIISYHPTLSHLQVKARVLSSVERLSSLEGKIITGGRINAYRALTNPDLPSIFRIDPLKAFPGDTITIGGVNFGTSGNVLMGSLRGNTTATVQSWNGSLISAVVPHDAVSSYVRIENAFGLSHGFYLRVLIRAPTYLRVRALSYNQVMLEWADNSTNEEGFIIYRRAEGEGSYMEIARVGANTTTYTDNGVMPSTRYYYKVVAYNAKEQSDPSNEEDITTPYVSNDDNSFGGCAMMVGKDYHINLMAWYLLILYVILKKLKRLGRA